MSSLVPEGSKIARVYFEIDPYPGAESPVGTFNKATQALDVAADYWVGRRAEYLDKGLPELPPFPTIVERWFIKHPWRVGTTATTDMPISADPLNATVIERSRVSRGLSF